MTSATSHGVANPHQRHSFELSAGDQWASIEQFPAKGRYDVVHLLFGTRVVNPSADLDEAMLKRMAEATGGRYFRARNSDGAWSASSASFRRNS